MAGRYFRHSERGMSRQNNFKCHVWILKKEHEIYPHFVFPEVFPEQYGQQVLKTCKVESVGAFIRLPKVSP